MSDLGIILNKAQHGNRDLQDNDAYSYGNTRLYDFLAKTSDTWSAGDVVDPLATFDVEFKFFPSLNSNSNFADSNVQSDAIIDSEYSKADATRIADIKALEKLPESAMTPDEKKAAIAKINLEYKNKNEEITAKKIEYDKANADKSSIIKKANAGSNNNSTFLDKIATSIYGANGPSDQLIIQMGYYIQSMTLPQMVMPEAGKVPTLFGEFPVNNLYVKPENNTFSMTLLNTKVSIHDYLFYPWMREVTMPIWSYDKQPYTTANVTVKFDKHSNLRYVFCGCRPTVIQSIQPTLEPEGAPTRDVTMLFDYMFITAACNNDTMYYPWALDDASNLYKLTSSLQNKLMM